MSESPEADFSRSPPWLSAGRGIGPKLGWHLGTDGGLAAMAYCRESGDLFTADRAGALFRVDRQGRIAALTRLHHSVNAIAWSDDGSHGAVLAGEDVVLRFDRQLKLVDKLDLPDVGLAIAVTPYGNHLAVSLAGGQTRIHSDRKRPLARFETIRPLAFLEFCAGEPLLFGAAEHGLICCHNLQGAEVWQQKNWANVGRMAISGDGHMLYLASFSHGIQCHDGDGQESGSYVLEGTVSRLSASFEPGRLIAGTVERTLFWLDSDGELLWGTDVSDDVVEVICDPLGEWILCGLAQQGIYRLDWASRSS